MFDFDLLIRILGLTTITAPALLTVCLGVPTLLARPLSERVTGRLVQNVAVLASQGTIRHNVAGMAAGPLGAAERAAGGVPLSSAVVADLREVGERVRDVASRGVDMAADLRDAAREKVEPLRKAINRS